MKTWSKVHIDPELRETLRDIQDFEKTLFESNVSAELEEKVKSRQNAEAMRLSILSSAMNTLSTLPLSEKQSFQAPVKFEKLESTGGSSSTSRPSSRSLS
jgi:hypothetical protein